MRICMSDAYQTIHLERMGAVAILTLSRPERMNAIDKQMLGELQDALDDVERDDELRVLVVKGAGANFSSGFDLKEQMEARPSGLTAWREILDRDFSAVTRFWHLKKPTIAAVRGYCLAGARHHHRRRGCDFRRARTEIRGRHRSHDSAVAGRPKESQGNHSDRRRPHLSSRSGADRPHQSRGASRSA